MGGHASPRKRLQQVFLLLLIFALVEIAVGFAVNSLALQGDGWHMMIDATGISVALIAALCAERMRDREEQERVEAVGAFITALLLLPPSYLLVAGGVKRLFDPQRLNAGWMSATALVGLLVNLVCMKLLAQYVVRHLNVRGARLHILLDLLDSVAVLVGGIIISTTGWYWIDGALAMLIGCFLAIQAALLARRAFTTVVQREKPV